MESSDYISFTSKLKEAEKIFLRLSQEEKEKGFKSLLTFKARCTEVVCNSNDTSYKQSTGTSKSPLKKKSTFIKDIKTEHSSTETFIRNCLDNLVSDAINLVEDKDKVWPSKRLRKRKSSVFQEVEDDNNDISDAPSPIGWEETADDTDDYEYSKSSSLSLSKRKRKQKFPRRSAITDNNFKAENSFPEGTDDMKENNPFILRLAKQAVELSEMLSEQTTKVVTKNRKKGKTRAKKKRLKHLKVGRPRKRMLYKCTDCEDTFTQSISYLEHVTRHGHQPCSCRTCMSEFGTAVEFVEHICDTKGTKKCKLCPKGMGSRFNTGKLLRDHMKNVHCVELMSRNYPCQFCEKSFTTKLWLHHHFKKHSQGKEVCLRCGEFCDGAGALKEHQKIHEKEVHFRCVKCDASFYHARHYDMHLQAHLQRECSLCDAKFQSRLQLNKHCQSEHNTGVDEMIKAKYSCDECDKSFDKPSALIVHQRIHTGERPVECKPCQQFFRTNKALFKHKQTYTHSVKAGEQIKERKFLCSECGKAYFRKHALQRHMRYHSGEKPHTCQHCGYQCREANNLKRHLSLHFEAERNFVCELCGAAFHAKKTLEMHHAYKHSDIRQFACSLCSLTFKAKNALKRHYKVHSTEKEHKCWCGTAFKRMYNLRRHLKAVHGADTILPPVRRVQPLDQPTKAPVSKTDLLNPKIIAEKKEKVPKPRRKPYQTMPRELTNPELYQSITPTSIAEEISESLKYTSMLMNVDNQHNQSNLQQIEHCYSLQQQQQQQQPQQSPPTPVPSPHRQPQTMRQQQQQQQQQPHSQQPEPPQHMATPDAQQRMRYNPNQDSQVYTNVMDRPAPLPHNIDPNDPFMQHMNTSLGNPNFIPQAVAYSTIMREYGSQFPFLPDGTNYHNYVNKAV